MTHDPDAPKGYDELKELAASLRRPIDSLIALSNPVDPFMAGRGARLAAARWVAELYERFKFKPGAHIRRIHYVLISQPSPVLTVGGEPYENTYNLYQMLNVSVRDARYLDLIPANAIIDRRNPEPTLHRFECVERSAEISTEAGEIDIMSAQHLFYHGSGLSLPSLSVSKPIIAQRYHLEIWCEKSTMNDVLIPLGEQYHINIVTGVGEMSVTQCEELINRALASGLPVRILYVSDFDPAGMSMPVAVARKIEFMARKLEAGDSELDLDIQVRNVVLTHDQCVEYQLPRTPLKESETRGAKFEARYGEGATELDALEAIHPGVLRSILVEEIERYHDSDLDDSIEEVVSEIEDQIDQIKSEIKHQHDDELQALAAEREALNAEGEAEIDKVRQLMAPKEAAYHLRAEQLLAAITAALEAEAPDVDGYDGPEAAEGDEDDDPLYDSTRTYLEQIDRYREHQDKPAETGLWQDRVFNLVCQRCGKSFTSPKPRTKVCSRTCYQALWRKANPKP